MCCPPCFPGGYILADASKFDQLSSVKFADFEQAGYEQKAVCILLTLLYLGMKDIYLGPKLPAFLSPGVLDMLVKEYRIHPVSDPESDLREILG